MSISLEQHSATGVLDGEVVIILNCLRSHTILDTGRLKVLVSKHLESEDRFQFVLAHALAEGLVQRSSSGSLHLSGQGEVWLDRQSTGLGVEEEDSGTEDTPTKPYEVAKLKMETRNISVFQALRKIERGEINLNPDFQRAFVWDQIRQSRLIESVLIRIPLPAFYLDATDQIRWNVVDGLQRLNTLWRYCRTEEFGLQGLQFLSELEGKYFTELPPQYRVLIEDDTQLLFYNLMPGTPLEAKFTIFSRVNTGGLQLTPQEIRHALNQGAVTTLLAELANHTTFRTATQGAVESLRMGDRELVLRALAFMHLGVGAYREFSELDAFLLHAMSKLNALPNAELAMLADDFTESLVKVYQIFDRYAYRKFAAVGGRRSPLNKALFESWTVNVRNYPIGALLQKRDNIVEGFVDLINDDYDFVRAISSSTGSYRAVLIRFKAIEQLLKGVLQ